MNEKVFAISINTFNFYRQKIYCLNFILSTRNFKLAILMVPNFLNNLNFFVNKSTFYFNIFDKI